MEQAPLYYLTVVQQQTTFLTVLSFMLFYYIYKQGQGKDNLQKVQCPQGVKCSDSKKKHHAQHHRSFVTYFYKCNLEAGKHTEIILNIQFSL